MNSRIKRINPALLSESAKVDYDICLRASTSNYLNIEHNFAFSAITLIRRRMFNTNHVYIGYRNTHRLTKLGKIICKVPTTEFEYTNCLPCTITTWKTIGSSQL